MAISNLSFRPTASSSVVATDSVTADQSPPFLSGTDGRAAGRLRIRGTRGAFRRTQLARATHFTQVPEPSFASAPHAHMGPVRHAIRRRLMLRGSSSSTHKRSRLPEVAVLMTDVIPLTLRWRPSGTWAVPLSKRLWQPRIQEPRAYFLCVTRMTVLLASRIDHMREVH